MEEHWRRSMWGIIPWLPPPLQVVRMLDSLCMPALPWLLLQCRDGEEASRKVVSSCHLSLEAMYDVELHLEVWASPSVACV